MDYCIRYVFHFQIQYGENGGRCGLCGDPYQGPREHEAGGKYANGIIVETYMQGGTIEVDVDITANHKVKTLIHHYDVITWERFPHHWPIARGIHR